MVPDVSGDVINEFLGNLDVDPRDVEEVVLKPSTVTVRLVNRDEAGEPELVDGEVSHDVTVPIKWGD